MIAKTWNEKQSAKKNLENMGLSYDPNHTVRQAIKHPERQAVSLNTLPISKSHVTF